MTKRITKTTLMYIVQGYYDDHGWEDLCGSVVYRESRDNIREYRDNAPGPYRLIKRRVPNPEYVCPTP